MRWSLENEHLRLDRLCYACPYIHLYSCRHQWIHLERMLRGRPDPCLGGILVCQRHNDYSELLEFMQDTGVLYCWCGKVRPSSVLRDIADEQWE
jgi:hypothetical protein